jgi:uncharacterized membrane protein
MSEMEDLPQSRVGFLDKEVLDRLKKLDSGFQERIIAEFESEARHRRKMEEMALVAAIADTLRGQNLGFVLGMIAIIVGGLTAMYGSQWAGGLIGSGGVIGLVSVFVTGRVLRLDHIGVFRTTQASHTKSSAVKPSKTVGSAIHPTTDRE